MTKRGRYCLLFLAVFLAAIIVFLVTLRLTNFGVIVLAFNALLKTLCGTPDDHQVVREYSQQTFTFA